MATSRQIEANRQNAQKSTGPRTEEGKDRSRFNAVTHGVAAKHDVLPGEDPRAFAARLMSWTGDLRPRNGVERYLAERAARVSWQLDRVENAHVSRLAARIHGAGMAEAQRADEEVAMLGRRLFWDPSGPLACYPNGSGEGAPHGRPQVSWAGVLDDPNHPARIVLRLESTAAGCHWLLARWAELGAMLAREQAWQSPDKLRAIRLLGQQPLDVFDDPRVATIFLACHAIDPRGGDLFHEIIKELTPDEIATFRARLAGRLLDWLRPRDEAAARETLFEIIERAVKRVVDKAGAHRQQAELAAELTATRLAFDDSDAGERLRRHEAICGRTLLRTLDTLTKMRRDGTAGESSPVEPSTPPYLEA